MDRGAIADYKLLRAFNAQVVIQHSEALFRLFSYARARDHVGWSAPSQVAHFIGCLVRDRIMPVSNFSKHPAIPRFIGGLSGRSGTTWIEHVFRHSLFEQVESIGERHFFWLSQFQSAAKDYWNSPSSTVSQRLKPFSEMVCGYGYRKRGENGAITYGGLARLLPRRAVDAALCELEKQLAGVTDYSGCEKAFGYFYQQLMNSWSAVVSGGPKPWISKEPIYGRDCRRLFRLIPNARLLVIARDGRDTARSILKSGWATDIETAVLRWHKEARATLDGLATLPKSQWMLVRFEDLVDDFDNQMEQILDFFGLERPQQKLRPRPVKLDQIPWYAEGAEEFLRMFEKECGATMRELGYKV